MKKRTAPPIKKSRSGRCVHCLQTVEGITDDHLFPRSWYPDTTAANLEKWTIPACLPCNNEYGRLESDLLLKLASALDPTGPATAGLWQRALRSINPDCGKNPLDSLKRKHARERFMKQLRHADPSLSPHTLPEIDPHRLKGSVAVLVSKKALERFIEKLVRGTIYLTEQRYVEKGRIGVSMMRLEDAAPVHYMMEKFGELYEREPGIRIRKAVAKEAPNDPFFVFDVWDQFRWYAYVEDDHHRPAEGTTVPAGSR